MDETPEITPVRRRKSKPKASPKPASKSLDYIDGRLADALAEKETASNNVSKLIYWQDRLTRITQEIEALIGYQQRLNGYTVTQSPVPVLATSTGIPYVVGTDVRGITSVPAKQPSPSGSNVAEDVVSDQGFS